MTWPYCSTLECTLIQELLSENILLVSFSVPKELLLLWHFRSFRKREKRRCGTLSTELPLLRSLVRQRSLTSLTQHPHRSTSVFCIILLTVMWNHHNLLRLLYFSVDGEITERRHAESIGVAGIARKEIQRSRTCLWLCSLAWWWHLEVSCKSFAFSI